MAVVPVATPLTTPLLFIVATPGVDEDHVPGVAVLAKVVVDVGQTVAVPVMAGGPESTLTAEVVVTNWLLQTLKTLA